ncbi:MAG TPA: hypothetical protein ENH62_13365 [Marinobacter sp.]|uniref:HK97 gp10 family phage protein n=1 Tax=marine sediment metagenome TaxID=412755 RepID=A0A0F9BZ11_9ZZZZ|nr:hypothetical protein [Marinobacter sp.]
MAIGDVQGFGKHVTLKGDKALERKLKRLMEPEKRRAVSKACKKALTPMAKAAKKIVKQDVDTGSGFFAKNIATKVKAYGKGAVVVGMLGARNKLDPATGENPSKIAHLLEFGTKPHFIEAGKGSLFRRKGVLSSEDDSRVDLDTNREPEVFGFRVSHPGAKGLHMFEKSFRRNHKRAATIYRRELAKDIEREAKRGGFNA